MTTRILRPTGRIWWLFFLVLGYNPLPSLILEESYNTGLWKDCKYTTHFFSTTAVYIQLC